MLTTILSAVAESAAAGVFPATVFLGVVTVVTVIALCRADRGDVPKIFASFTSAFGFHKHSKSDAAVTDRDDDHGCQGSDPGQGKGADSSTEDEAA
ncbi:hypothetical protein ACIBJI_41905 [Nocardia sp. NPDC050408]|uniref:hypothetical protein n=1 Tax=Nocardia sp. NPDC050408 TaxID=3364319 RepID=UPI0037B9373F